MLTQTINLLASARPNLGGQEAGSVSAGGALPVALGRTTVQDEATILRTAGGKAGRRTARRRWSPGGRGGSDGSGRKPPPFRGPTVADRRRGLGRGCRRISGGRRGWRIPWGRGRGAPRKRRSGRMTAAAEEEDTSTMADRGRKSG
jgi:hypothetical protein